MFTEDKPRPATLLGQFTNKAVRKLAMQDAFFTKKTI
jgi:hypothetical protein